MKHLCLITFITIFTTSAFAQNEPPKSGLETIIEAMAEQYARSAAQDLIMKKLQEEAAKKLGEQMAEQLGHSVANILAAIGLVENVKSYDEAKTEGQKYSAAAHATANAISIATAPIPVIGLVAQLVVMCQDLTAAFVSKDFILEQARIRADIIRIYKNISDLQTKEFDAEMKSYKMLADRLTAIGNLSQTAANLHLQYCEKDEFDFKTPEACLASLMTLQQLLLKQVQGIQAIVNFNGRFLNASSLGLEHDKLQTQLNEANEKLEEISKSIRYALSQVAFNQILAIKSSTAHARILRECQVSITVQLKDILLSKKELMDGGEHQSWEGSSLEEKKMTLQNLTQGLCQEYFIGAPDEMKSITARALR